MTKKQIRQEFRNSVFKRDNYKCVCCKAPGVDAHHITDRNEVYNGGYLTSNGITLCSDCHIKAEEYHISSGLNYVQNYHPNDLYKKINSSKIEVFLRSLFLNINVFGSYLKDMSKTDQDPEYHAEGDVLTHTYMVIKELLKLDEYKSRTKGEQYILCLSALLHDIAKPKCTIIEDGRIKSPKHAKVGEKMVRELLWSLEFNTREFICSLVRLHGLPLWAIDKDLPNKAVIKSSLRVDNSMLYILTKADILGRICKDQQDLLDRLEYFKELCLEQDCFNEAKIFPNEHSRFKFFQKKSLDNVITLHDDTKFKVVILCGIAGSGKDTYAKSISLPVVSLDELRKKHKVKRGDKKGQGQITQLAYENAKNYCRNKQSFIWNSTNLSRDMRSKIIDKLSVYNPRFEIVYIQTSIEELINRRKKTMKKEVIYNMLRVLDIPEKSEAHKLLTIET